MDKVEETIKMLRFFRERYSNAQIVFRSFKRD